MEENNIYRMLTHQQPVSNFENHGFCSESIQIVYSKSPENSQL